MRLEQISAREHFKLDDKTSKANISLNLCYKCKKNATNCRHFIKTVRKQTKHCRIAFLNHRIFCSRCKASGIGNAIFFHIPDPHLISSQLCQSSDAKEKLMHVSKKYDRNELESQRSWTDLDKWVEHVDPFLCALLEVITDDDVLCCTWQLGLLTSFHCSIRRVFTPVNVIITCHLMALHSTDINSHYQSSNYL